MSIRESDLFGVYIADKLLLQYEGTPIYDSLCSVFKKLEQSLPDKISMDPTNDHLKFTVIPPFSTTIDPVVWDIVINCLRSSQQMEMTYKTPGKNPVARTVDPYHGVRFEGDWYVVGYCHLRHEIRTFSLSRIVKVSKIDYFFNIPRSFNFLKVSGSHFGVHWSDGNMNVKIRFTKYVADYVRERKWHKSQEITECNNGDIVLSLTVNHLLELKRWILSWGADAKVIEPAYFAEDIQMTFNKAIRQYQN